MKFRVYLDNIWNEWLISGNNLMYAHKTWIEIVLMLTIRGMKFNIQYNEHMRNGNLAYRDIMWKI